MKKRPVAQGHPGWPKAHWRSSVSSLRIIVPGRRVRTLSGFLIAIRTLQRKRSFKVKRDLSADKNSAGKGWKWIRGRRMEKGKEYKERREEENTNTDLLYSSPPISHDFILKSRCVQSQAPEGVVWQKTFPGTMQHRSLLTQMGTHERTKYRFHQSPAWWTSGWFINRNRGEGVLKRAVMTQRPHE